MPQPFVIGVIADLSGAAHPARSFLSIDRDDFDAVLARVGPRLELEGPERLAFRRFADFHPDGLIDGSAELALLLEAREATGEPARMRALLARASGAELAGEAAQGSAQRPEGPIRTTEPELLDAILERRPLASDLRVVPAPRDPEFERLVAEVVDRSGQRVERADSAERARWRGAIERELASRVRRVLHDARFRRLEAVWRSLHALCHGVETGEDLRIRVLDVSQEELTREVDGGRALEETLLHRLVVEREHGTRGGEPFGLLVTDHVFGGDETDGVLLAHLAALAGRASVPCLASLAPTLWTEDAFDWPAVARLGERARKLEGADRLGLCCPRILLRAPYGRAGVEVDRFPFEEHPDGAHVSECVWGSAAFAVARVAANAHTTLGSAALAPRLARLEGLPFHASRVGGDVSSLGPTDRLLSDREVERLIGAGLVPMAAARGSDTATILSFRSLAGTPLF